VWIECGRVAVSLLQHVHISGAVISSVAALISVEIPKGNPANDLEGNSGVFRPVGRERLIGNERPLTNGTDHPCQMIINNNGKKKKKRKKNINNNGPFFSFFLFQHLNYALPPRGSDGQTKSRRKEAPAS
jgi:hypothetical protein